MIGCCGNLTKNPPAEKRQVFYTTRFVKRTTECGKITACWSETCVREGENRAKSRCHPASLVHGDVGLCSIIVHAQVVAGGAGGQGGHDLGGGVGDKLHVAVGEDEVGAALVRAPEVKHVALVVEVAGAVAVRTGRTE